MADQGICIGINTYPGLSNLAGPCNDAIAFKKWLIDPQKGGLNSANVRTLLSINYTPATPHVADARPFQDDLHGLFMPYIEAAVRQQHVGGRLFIFVAGHGFADPHDLESAALFAANARQYFAANLSVRKYVDFIRKHWIFDEVILVMDACRTASIFQRIGEPPLPILPPHPNSNKVKYFLGYGAGFNQVTREKSMSGEMRGVFTTAVLDALENAPANRNGRVTGSLVKGHVHNVIDGIAGFEAKKALAIYADDDKDVVFLDRSQSTTSGMDFYVTDDFVNHEIIIEEFGGNEIIRHHIANNHFKLNLAPGYFKARIPSLNFEKLIEASGNVRLER